MVSRRHSSSKMPRNGWKQQDWRGELFKGSKRYLATHRISLRCEETPRAHLVVWVAESKGSRHSLGKYLSWCGQIIDREGRRSPHPCTIQQFLDSVIATAREVS